MDLSLEVTAPSLGGGRREKIQEKQLISRFSTTKLLERLFGKVGNRHPLAIVSETTHLQAIVKI